MNTKPNINIDKKVFKKHKVKLVYLFGSRVKGDAVKESDYDIAVLFKKTPIDPLALKEITFLSSDLNKIIPAKLDTVCLNSASSLLKYEVIAHSRPIYCENEKERINFEVSVIKEYIDDQFMRDIYTQALVKRINKGTF